MTKINTPRLLPRSGQKARNMVVFLHGYGANGQDLLDIGNMWSRDLSDTVFVAPNAPEVCEAYAAGYQWFSIRAPMITQEVMDHPLVLQSPSIFLSTFLDSVLKEYQIDDSQLVVAGFSQGAMMAMYTMPRRKKACAGILSWSGMLLDSGGLKREEIVKMPVLATHGTEDTVVPPSSLEKLEQGLRSADFEVRTIMRPYMAHHLDDVCLQESLKFIQSVLKA